ncbi:MAG: futalosine hydrolase [Fibrobacteraceae bacterium]|nr:futalosine hydrolase [Fibrobacteraceae bacterium]
MNDTLVAFASDLEMVSLFPEYSEQVNYGEIYNGEAFDVGAFGVGLLNFSTNFSFALSKNPTRYKQVFMVGICGAYLNRDLAVGDVVRVDREIIGDMGVQNKDKSFTPWSKIRKGDLVCFKSPDPWNLPLSIAILRSVISLSVNCCAGSNVLSLLRSKMFEADIETMEGAAAFAVCEKYGIKCFEFRAVSNMVADRDPSQWKIQEALKALKETVLLPDFFHRPPDC